MNVRNVPHRVVDLPLGGGTTLRIAIAHDDEAGDSLVLSRGFGGSEPGDPFRRPHWAGDPLVLPAAILPELRAALATLDLAAER